MLHENHDQRTMTMDIRSASRPKMSKDTSQLYLYLNDVEARRTDVVKSVHTSSYLQIHVLPTGKCDWGILTFAQQLRSVWFLSRNNLIEMYKWMPTKHKEKLFLRVFYLLNMFLQLCICENFFGPGVSKVKPLNGSKLKYNLELKNVTEFIQTLNKSLPRHLILSNLIFFCLNVLCMYIWMIVCN